MQKIQARKLLKTVLIQLLFITLLPICLEAADNSLQDKVFEHITSLQKKGLEEHQLDEFMQLWSKDVKQLLGRGKLSSIYDTTLNYEKLHQTRLVRFWNVPPWGLKASYKLLSFKEKATHLEVHMIANFTFPGGLQKVHEHYKRRDEKGQFKAFYYKLWPLEFKSETEHLKYTEELWKSLDNAVQAAQTPEDIRQLPSLLVRAQRMGEAHQASIKVTGFNDAEANIRALIATGGNVAAALEMLLRG